MDEDRRLPGRWVSDNRPDLWGFGLTEGWIDGSLTHDHQAVLVAAVIEDVVRGPAHVVRHSYIEIYRLDPRPRS